MTTKTTKIKAVPDTEPVTPTVTDAELHEQIAALEAERASLKVPNGAPGRYFVDSAHREIDRSVEAARATVDAVLTGALRKLATSGGVPIFPAGLADVWILATDPRAAARWHELLDSPPDPRIADVFRRDLTRAEHDAAVVRIDAAISTLRARLQLPDAVAVAEKAAARVETLRKSIDDERSDTEYVHV